MDPSVQPLRAIDDGPDVKMDGKVNMLGLFVLARREIFVVCFLFVKRKKKQLLFIKVNQHLNKAGTDL